MILSDRAVSTFNGGKVYWSDQAPVVLDDGRCYSPFQRYSYSARVEFTDGSVVMAVLPCSAATSTVQEWAEQVIEAARTAHESGATAVVFDEQEA